MQRLQSPLVKQVLVTCYTLNGNGNPKVGIGPYQFNWNSAVAGADDNYYVWEAARSTSAAPTYFPLANVGAGTPNGSQALTRWNADGGVAANNPAMYALAAARQADPILNLDEVLIVSLGTGIYNPAINTSFSDINWEDKTGNWGTIPWVNGSDVLGHSTVPLLNVLTMSNVLAPDQQLSELMPGGNFFRLEPQISYAESGMDAPDTGNLLTTATAYIAPNGPGAKMFNSVVNILKGLPAKAAGAS